MTFFDPTLKPGEVVGMGCFIGMDRKQQWNGAFRKPMPKLKAKLPAERHLAMNSIQAIGLYVF